MYYDNQIPAEANYPVELDVKSVPAVVRKDFRDVQTFTAADVTRCLKEKYGHRFARGVVGTALWRMALSGELHVTNNVHDDRPIARFKSPRMLSYWTNKKHRVYTWTR